jgi:hypothetical protein
MPANRFDTPYGQQYVSQYVQAPLSEISGMAREYSDKYKQAEEDTYKLNDLMAHVNAIDEHSPYKKALSERYHPKINELADKIIKGTDLPTAKRDLNKLQREFANDPLRQELEKSYAEKALYQKDKISKGEKYAEWEDPSIKFKGTTSKGELEPFRYTGMGEKQDHQKVAQDMMKDIGVDAKDYSNVQLGSDGIIRGSKGGREYILSDKVRNLANAKTTDFINTPAGSSYIKQLKYYNPNATEKQLLDEASKYLFNAGSNQIFNKTESGNTIDVTGLANDLRKEEMANRTTSSQSEAIANDAVTNTVSKIGEMKFDSKGELVLPTKTNTQYDSSKGTTGVMGASGANVTRGTDLEKMTEQVRFIQDLQKTHPGLKGLTPQKTVEAYTKAMKSLASESIPLESISNVAAKNIGDAIARNKHQRNFYLYDDKGTTTDGTFETVLDKLNIPEEDLDKALKEGIGGYTQAGPSAGSYYVEVKDKDGNSRRVTISPDSEEQKMFKTSQSLNTARKSMTRTVVQPLENKPNYKISVEPSIKSDGTTTWNYTEFIVNDNGDILQANPTTLDNIRKAERDAFKASGYLGSNLGVLKDNTTN